MGTLKTTYPKIARTNHI